MMMTRTSFTPWPFVAFVLLVVAVGVAVLVTHRSSAAAAWYPDPYGHTA
jgi:hypothetical protein